MVSPARESHHPRPPPARRCSGGEGVLAGLQDRLVATAGSDRGGVDVVLRGGMRAAMAKNGAGRGDMRGILDGQGVAAQSRNRCGLIGAPSAASVRALMTIEMVCPDSGRPVSPI